MKETRRDNQVNIFQGQEYPLNFHFLVEFFRREPQEEEVVGIAKPIVDNGAMKPRKLVWRGGSVVIPPARE